MKLTQEEEIGYRIIIKAMKEPIKTMAFNAGLEDGEIIAKIMDSSDSRYGYNFLTNEYGDMMDMGIIDPTKVVKLSLQNAASAAGMLLTTEVSIHEWVGEDLMPRTPKNKSE